MVNFSSLVGGLSVIAAALAIPSPIGATEKRGDFNFHLTPDNPLSVARRNATLAKRSNTNYNQNYVVGGGVSYSPSTNAFSVTWNTQSDFVVGVGWNPGSNAPITHSGTFNINSGLGSMGVYGWTTNPLIEYYIMESMTGIGASAFGTLKGTVTSDGGTYNVYQHTQVNQPSIQGTTTFQQFISVRTSGRTSGTVTVQNHFNAWSGYNMKLGSMNYQVIAVESWSGSGSAQQSVSNTGGGNTGGTTTTSSRPQQTTANNGGGGGGGGGSCSAMWGQCGGLGWTGPTCCSSGSCKAGNAYYSQCL